jgi:hypothetical protein
MKLFFLVVLSVLSFSAFSQNISVKGKISVVITNEQQSKIEGASVELLQRKDSSLIKATLSNKEGLAEFENINAGDYLLGVSMLNHTHSLLRNLFCHAAKTKYFFGRNSFTDRK